MATKTPKYYIHGFKKTCLCHNSWCINDISCTLQLHPHEILLLVKNDHLFKVIWRYCYWLNRKNCINDHHNQRGQFHCMRWAYHKRPDIIRTMLDVIWALCGTVLFGLNRATQFSMTRVIVTFLWDRRFLLNYACAISRHKGLLYWIRCWFVKLYVDANQTVSQYKTLQLFNHYTGYSGQNPRLKNSKRNQQYKRLWYSP